MVGYVKNHRLEIKADVRYMAERVQVRQKDIRTVLSMEFIQSFTQMKR